MALFLFFIIIRFSYSRAQSSGCNYFYEFSPKGPTTATLVSPNYPSNYPPNVDCRYSFSSSPETSLAISCEVFNLEPSSGCTFDVFFVSKNADSSFRDQEFFCGSGSWNRSSIGNRLIVGFHSDDTNPSTNSPLRFQCQVSVKGQGTSQDACSCGESNNGMARIVGGVDSGVGEFPWRVSLYSGKLGVFCGGTIISKNYVLTAAHCTAAVEPSDTIYVNAGDHDLSSDSDSVNALVPVDYVLQNSMYNPESQDSDLALLKLQSPLVYKANIAPVCLPWKFRDTDFNGKLVTASGWGTQYFGGARSPVLKKVELPILETEACAEHYASSLLSVTRNMICTGLYPGKDTCQGDSGGSIDYKDPSNGHWYALGVTSQGVSCGELHAPAIYSKINKFLSWIQGNTGESFCKL